MKKPVLIIIAGPNGSGKTSITSKILQHEWVESCLYVNPDNIAKDTFGDWNSREAVLNAAKYSTQIREECIEKKEGLIFETVLSPYVFSTLIYIGEPVFKLPLNTVSPVTALRGTLSPVSAFVSRYVSPEVIVPSRGIFSPGFTIIISPIKISDGETFVIVPFTSVLA